jgi:error-prone DNA polymerase
MGGGGSLPPGRPAKPGTRRVLVHASGFTQSPYADVKPAGEDTRGARALATPRTVPDAVPGADASGIAKQRDGQRAKQRDGQRDGWRGDEENADVTPDDMRTLGTPPRKLWHASPGSSGH